MSARPSGRDGGSDPDPGRIALLYALVGLAWIFGSGLVVAALPSGWSAEVVELGKGTGFVVVTAGALYVLLTRRGRAIRAAGAARLEADEERARLAAAVEQAAEAIVITDRDAHIVYVNPAFERVSGYPRAELLGANPSLLKSGRQDRAFYAEMWSTLLAGETWHGVLHNRRKDGTLYEEDAVLTPIRDPAGAVVSYVGVKRDITQERALEHQLAEAGRLDAVGQLAGGIAHDFNNLLTAISGYAELLKKSVGADPTIGADLDEILRASRSAAGLVRQMLAFSRRQVLAPAGVELEPLVEQLRPMLSGLLGPSTRLTVLSDESLDPVFADAGQLEQVLVNLAVNARDAMPSGGTFVITMSNREVHAGDEGANLVKAGRYVVLSAIDTGVGMDEATRQRVFEPFFTTKPTGQGTGLGLATAYGIVKQSGGYLFAASEPGQGATFTVYLPRHEGSVPPRPLMAPIEPFPGGTETVLVVEDDRAVQAIVRQALERLGYRVVSSSDAEEATVQAAAELGPLPLLVTDIRLPGLDGPGLAARLRAGRPGLRVLYISGYASDALVQSGLLEPGAAFLAKPFSGEELGRRVRSLLDAERSGPPA